MGMESGPTRLTVGDVKEQNEAEVELLGWQAKVEAALLMTEGQPYRPLMLAGALRRLMMAHLVQGYLDFDVDNAPADLDDLKDKGKMAQRAFRKFADALMDDIQTLGAIARSIDDLGVFETAKNLRDVQADRVAQQGPVN